MKLLVLFLLGLIFLSGQSTACQDKTRHPKAEFDPKRCERIDLGEATDLVHRDDIPDNQMVAISGMADPRALVWRNELNNKTFYITRVMGTNQRLYYFREIEAGEKPGIATRFEGQLRRWDRLPTKQFDSVRGALSKKYNIDVNPETSWVVVKDGKPEGCD